MNIHKRWQQLTKMNIRLLLFLFLPLTSFGQTEGVSSFVKEKINHKSISPVNSILLYKERINKGDVFNQGFGLRNNASQPVLKDDQFRIASTTKTFVAIIILQLKQEGKIKLDNKANQYLKNMDFLDFNELHLLNGKSHSNEITIEHLLSHRTGLADIFTDKEEEFFTLLLQNTQQEYSPKKIVELYYQLNLNTIPHFKPNKGWYYSDMNYVLLGLIIESIDKRKLAESIRNRILNPLKMENTYFEFYESPSRNNNLIHQYIGDIDMTEINTSFDWAGGGLVSNNEDLAIFIKALFNLKLINQESLNKMIDVKYTKEQENRYGLGIYESEYNGDTYYGHYGFYGSYVGFCPEKKIVLSYSISQAAPDFNVYSFINNIMKLSPK